jgi:methylated-DNA-[protein]-cysteine S-methyltransferase
VIYTTYFQSPVGLLEISGTEEGITTVIFANAKTSPRLKVPETANNPKCIRDCIWQLGEYFEGKRKTFLLPIILHGTDFQKQVWNQLLNIPYGKTISYSCDMFQWRIDWTCWWFMGEGLAFKT